MLHRRLADEAMNATCGVLPLTPSPFLFVKWFGEFATLIPLVLVLLRKIKDVVLYYEVTAWWQGKKGEVTKISEASLTKFVPSSRERENWDKLTRGEMQSFTVPTGNEIRAFRRIKGAKGELILLLDTGRRSDYSRDSW
jgi:hypothetical protein